MPSRLLGVLTGVTLPLALVAPVAGAPAELISVTPFGNSGNRYSAGVQMSADGRYVVFQSKATNLTEFNQAGTCVPCQDIWVRDRMLGTTTHVSVPWSPLEVTAGACYLTAASHSPPISADGRYVAFVSVADNLVPIDFHVGNDAFVRDLQEETTILVDVNKFGYASSGGGLDPVITPDGRYAAFTSGSDLLASDQTLSNVSNVYVRDLQMDTTILVSVNTAGTGHANHHSFRTVISDDGRYVAFMSLAKDLVTIPDPYGWTQHIFVRDLELGTTELVDINAAGTAVGAGICTSLDMTPDGRYVVFVSGAADLVPNDTNYDPLVENSGYDVFVRDTQANTTTLVSVNCTGTASGNASSGLYSDTRLTPDGRFVLFQSKAPDLTYDTDASPWGDDVFTRDLQAQTTTLVSVNAAGSGAGNAGSWSGRISDDGRFVSFGSAATDLASGDNDGAWESPDENDVYLRDLQTARTYLVSANPGGISGNGESGGSWLTPDGKKLALSSRAGDLVPYDANNDWDIFYYDLEATVGVGESATTPGRTGIVRAWPNPAHSQAQVRFDLRQPARVALEAYDPRGSLVGRLPERSWEAGSWVVSWPARSQEGAALSAGLYFLRLRVNGVPGSVAKVLVLP